MPIKRPPLQYCRYDVPKSCEVALFYMKTAADVAYDIYNSPGGQTRLENVRLTESLSMVREDHKVGCPLGWFWDPIQCMCF